jgi:hypothetical protein
MNMLQKTTVSLALMTSLASFGCSVAPATESTGEVTEALTAAAAAPVTATIADGVGAADARLGMTQDEVAAKLGAPSSCTGASATSTQTCTYKSADGIVRASATFDIASPRRLSVINVPFSNSSWKTLKGIAVASTETAFKSAYGSSIDAARSTYYSKVVPGVDAAGNPSETRFSLGWFNEYQPNQYFGVISVTVARGIPTGSSGTPTTGGATAPATATITDGVGAAGAWLGMTQDEVATKLGIPFSCAGSTATTTQKCTYKSADGIVRASATFDVGSPRRLSVISVPFSNASWKTLKGIAVGSTETSFVSAYGSSIDASRSTYYSKVVPGVDAAGNPSDTRFSLGWFNEYQPNQYFGVVSVTVARR